MDIDKEPLLSEKEEEAMRRYNFYMRHRRRRMSTFSSIIVLLVTVALIITLTRFLAGTRLRLGNIQLILFQSDAGKSQLSGIDFVAEGNCRYFHIKIYPLFILAL